MTTTTSARSYRQPYRGGVLTRRTTSCIPSRAPPRRLRPAQLLTLLLACLPELALHRDEVSRPTRAGRRLSAADRRGRRRPDHLASTSAKNAEIARAIASGTASETWYPSRRAGRGAASRTQQTAPASVSAPAEDDEQLGYPEPNAAAIRTAGPVTGSTSRPKNAIARHRIPNGRKIRPGCHSSTIS
jgi:hypothetical protein